MPGEGQALDVSKELVAYALDEALGALREEEPLTEDGKAAQHGEDDYGPRRPDQGHGRVSAQYLQRQRIGYQRRQLRLLGAEDGVHGDADYLGYERVEDLAE